MKKRYSKIFFGVLAVFAGIALAVYAFVPTLSLGTFSIWKIAGAIGLLYWILHNLWNGETIAKKLDIFIPLALMLILFKSNIEYAVGKNDLFDSWLIILAAIVLTVAMEILFGNAKCNTGKYGSNVKKNKFSGSTLYIDASKSEVYHIENKFGAVEVFFQNTEEVDPCSAVELNIYNRFGAVEINAPADWFVENRIENSLAAVEQRPNPSEYTGKLILTGKNNFGAVEVKWHIAVQLSKKSTRFQYKLIKSGARAAEFENAVEWLVMANPVSQGYHTQLENAKIEVEKPFPHEEELKTKTERLAELNALLGMDKKENEIVDGEREDEDDREQERSDSRDTR